MIGLLGRIYMIVSGWKSPERSRDRRIVLNVLRARIVLGYGSHTHSDLTTLVCAHSLYVQLCACSLYIADLLQRIS